MRTTHVVALDTERGRIRQTRGKLIIKQTDEHLAAHAPMPGKETTAAVGSEAIPLPNKPVFGYVGAGAVVGVGEHPAPFLGLSVHDEGDVL